MFSSLPRASVCTSMHRKPLPNGPKGEPRLGLTLRRQQLLVIEDDIVLGDLVQDHLDRAGFDVTLCSDGRNVPTLLNTNKFELLLMDIQLPGDNGLDILSLLRATHRLPVILMSALGSESDRIAGFIGGADDYLPKPFSLEELEVRVAAVLRRVAFERGGKPHRTADLTDSQLHCDESRQDINVNGQWAGLTATEYRLLMVLLHNKEVQSKAFLYQQVLHRPFTRHDRALDMHVSHLRRKLQASGYTRGSIDAVWGKGYVLKSTTAGKTPT